MRKHIRFDTSSGLPSPRGWLSIIFCLASGGTDSNSFSVIGVFTIPGRTQLQRIFFPASSSAIAFTPANNADLLEQYATFPGSPSLPLTELRKIKEAPAGSAMLFLESILAISKAAKTLTSNISLKTSGVEALMVSSFQCRHCGQNHLSSCRQQLP